MDNYLKWLEEETPTVWWNDSAIPSEIKAAIENGAQGVTTNPILTYKALQENPGYWEEKISHIAQDAAPEERAEELLRVVTVEAAKQFEQIYVKTNKQNGYALGQLNPAICHDSGLMLAQALRYNAWGENIAVKLPTIMSALPVIEELAARGIAVCTTLNFSISQGIAAGEAYERGVKKAKAAGVEVKPCFVVQQGGRLDEYLAESAKDSNVSIDAGLIQNAGNAVCKKLYGLFKERGVTAKIMPAGLRRVKHLTEMAGADMVFSLQPRIQQMVLNENPVKKPEIDNAISEMIIEQLRNIPEFVRAYDEGAMKPEEFYGFGVTQKTLSQFLWTGWIPLETYGAGKVSKRWF